MAAAVKPSFIYLEEVLSWSAASVFIFLASLNEPGLENLSSDEEGLLLFSMAMFSLMQCCHELFELFSTIQIVETE